MIALDTNLLVYAYREDSEFHSVAMEQIRPVIEGDAPWALPWTCVHEFIGVVTSGRVYKPASPLPSVLGYLDSLMASPQLHLLTESPGWQLFLAGYGTGLLDLVKREGRCDIHRAGPDIECIYTYESAPLR